MVKANTRQKALYSLILLSTLGLLLNVQPASAYTFNGYELRDLQAHDRDNFEKEADGWEASRLVNKDIITSQCGGEYLVGGCNVLGDLSSTDGEYFKRSYRHIDLPKHNMVYFAASFSLIDTWEAYKDKIKIYINDEKLGDLHFNSKDFRHNKCGGPGKDLTDVYVVGKVPHQHEHLTIRIVSDSKHHHDKISFGFREISVLFVDVPKNKLKNDLCASALVPLSLDQCECPKGQFLQEVKSALTGKPVKKCVPGSPQCASSFGPSAYDCFECRKGTFFDGKKCVECSPECAECVGPRGDQCMKDKYQYCHKGHYFWAEGGSNQKCLEKCPEGWRGVKDEHENKICVPQCDCNKHEKTWFAEINECRCECPSGWRIDNVNQVPRCVHICQKHEKFWEEGCEGGACVEKCPKGWKSAHDNGIEVCQKECCDEDKDNIWFDEKRECVCECPDGWEQEKLNDVLVCTHTCQDCQFWWKEGGHKGSCVDKCPDGWKCDKGCEGVDICSPQCNKKDDENIWFQEKKECVCECPDGWKVEKVNDVHACVKACDEGQFWWKGACVCECPEGWKCDQGCEGVDICTPQCNKKDDENIWFQEKGDCGECVCECPDGWKEEKINDVHACVKACDEGQFWWNGACVCECPEGWKCDQGCEGVDICTPQCDLKSEENIWYPKYQSCDCECPDGWRAEKINEVLVCDHVCEEGQFWWGDHGDKGACVCECPEGWKPDNGHGKVPICTPQCDCDEENDDKNIWFAEKGDCGECVCECPDGWKKEKVNDVRVCAKVCDKGQFWWQEDGKEGACVCECPEGWKCDQGCEGVDICSPQCDPKDEENIWFPKHQNCGCECPDGWRAEKINGVLICEHVCEEGQYWWDDHGKNGACVEKCPEGWKCDKGIGRVDICTPQCDCNEDNADKPIWFEAQGECVCECPDGWEVEKLNDVLTCQHTCKDGQFWWQDGSKKGACVDNCPDGWKWDKGCEGVDICAPQCDPKDDCNIWFGEKGDCGECVDECAAGWRKEKVNGVKVCVHACEKGQFWWQEDGKEGACVCECPEGWKCDQGCEGVDICSPQCDRESEENIWYPKHQNCGCECPDGWRAEKINDVLICEHVCEEGQFWWSEHGEKGACVCECPEGWKADKGHGKVPICTPQCDCDEENDDKNIWFAEKGDCGECVYECPAGWKKEKVNDVRVCKHACEKGQFFWEDCDQGPTCVDKCPDGWKCDQGVEGVDICSPECDQCDEENIWFQENKQCVCQCPEGWKPEKINDVLICEHACEEYQFWWNGACVNKCPEGWKCDKGCEGVDICVPKCDCNEDNADKPIWFEQKGECVCDCPEGWRNENLNDVPACVQTCEKGQFFWEEGGKHGACVDKCPEGWKCDKGCEGVDLCSPQCDPNCNENIWFQEECQCVCNCPDGWRTEKVNNVPQCVKACDNGEFWWQEGADHGACVCDCPDGWTCGKGAAGVDICVPHCNCEDPENIWFQEKNYCVCDCPTGWRTEKLNEVLVCVEICEKGEFFWEKGGQGGACVCNCPDGWQCGKGDAGVDICVPQCDCNNDKNIWFREQEECVCECPCGWEKEKVNAVDVCRKACHNGQFFWEEGGDHGVCVDDCPEGWECAQDKNGLSICKPKCNEKSKEKIWLEKEKQCVCDCPDGFESDIVNKVPSCVPCQPDW